MVQIQPFAAGNWKMNGLKRDLDEIESLCEHVQALGSNLRSHVMVCPPVTLIPLVVDRCASSGVMVGAQDCHTAKEGAHTGDVSAEMLHDAGAEAVIVGHSERRGDHGETDAMVKAKSEAAHRAGLIAIVCIGETEGQRRYGLTFNVLGRQLSASVPNGASAVNTIIAYEPVWAIGTGVTPSPEDVEKAHAFIRKHLIRMRGVSDGERMRLLYGGSVKPSNAGELLSVGHVDGALVGGASLKANDFCGILDAFVTK